MQEQQLDYLDAQVNRLRELFGGMLRELDSVALAMGQELTDARAAFRTQDLDVATMDAADTEASADDEAPVPTPVVLMPDAAPGELEHSKDPGPRFQHSPALARHMRLVRRGFTPGSGK